MSASGIRLALLRLKITYKKTWNHLKADKAKPALFQEKITAYQDARRSIVYLDESGFAHNFPRTPNILLKQY